MNDSAITRWGNEDITSDGRIVEECVHTADRGRRVTWYDAEGRERRSGEQQFWSNERLLA